MWTFTEVSTRYRYRGDAAVCGVAVIKFNTQIKTFENGAQFFLLWWECVAYGRRHNKNILHFTQRTSYIWPEKSFKLLLDGYPRVCL